MPGLKTILKTELHETHKKWDCLFKKGSRGVTTAEREKDLFSHSEKEEQFEQLQIFASGNSLRRNREIGDTEHLTDGQPNYRGTVCALCKYSEWSTAKRKIQRSAAVSVRWEVRFCSDVIPPHMLCSRTAKYLYKSIFKKSLHLGFGVFIGIWSMHPPMDVWTQVNVQGRFVYNCTYG